MVPQCKALVKREREREKKKKFGFVHFYAHARAAPAAVEASRKAAHHVDSSQAVVQKRTHKCEDGDDFLLTPNT